MWTPYNYVGDNPVNAIDPDGKDIILLIWATANGNIGHASIAIEEYRTQTYKAKEKYKDANGKTRTREVEKQRQVKTGIYTYMDLWPGGDGQEKRTLILIYLENTRLKPDSL